eukprot:scaffold7202_cov403-Prasinococcus_capsulatus_cf.AAC.8
MVPTPPYAACSPPSEHDSELPPTALRKSSHDEKSAADIASLPPPPPPLPTPEPAPPSTLIQGPAMLVAPSAGGMHTTLSAMILMDPPLPPPVLLEVAPSLRMVPPTYKLVVDMKMMPPPSAPSNKPMLLPARRCQKLNRRTPRAQQELLTGFSSQNSPQGVDVQSYLHRCCHNWPVGSTGQSRRRLMCSVVHCSSLQGHQSCRRCALWS